METHQPQCEFNSETRVLQIYCPICQMSRQIYEDGGMRTLHRGDPNASHISGIFHDLDAQIEIDQSVRNDTAH